ARLLGRGEGSQLQRAAAGREECSALADRLLKQSLRERRRHQRTPRQRSPRLTEDSDVLRIAAERRDVLLTPPQRGNLIEHAVVARRVMTGLAREIRVREEAE